MRNSELSTPFKTLLDASDTPKMLERFESYKKLTDIAADAVREEWDRESDLLCCFEIDDELELLRPLYQEVDCPTRRRALRNVRLQNLSSSHD